MKWGKNPRRERRAGDPPLRPTNRSRRSPGGNGERPSSIGVDLSQPGRDLLRGAGRPRRRRQRAGLYYLAFRAGTSLNIVAVGLPDVWWRFPVLVLSVLQDGINEEVLVVGYTLLATHVSWLP